MYSLLCITDYLLHFNLYIMYGYFIMRVVVNTRKKCNEYIHNHN